MENPIMKLYQSNEEKINNIIKFFSDLKDKIEIRQKYGEEEMLQNLNKAHSEWKKAELYFQSVTEPELIDHAIYNLEAARTKYLYLLKQARRKKIKVNN